MYLIYSVIKGRGYVAYEGVTNTPSACVWLVPGTYDQFWGI